jgi:hypothetical protein
VLGIVNQLSPSDKPQLREVLLTDQNIDNILILEEHINDSTGEGKEI